MLYFKIFSSFLVSAVLVLISFWHWAKIGTIPTAFYGFFPMVIFLLCAQIAILSDRVKKLEVANKTRVG